MNKKNAEWIAKQYLSARESESRKQIYRHFFPSRTHIQTEPLIRLIIDLIAQEDVILQRGEKDLLIRILQLIRDNKKTQNQNLIILDFSIDYIEEDFSRLYDILDRLTTPLLESYVVQNSFGSSNNQHSSKFESNQQKVNNNHPPKRPKYNEPPVSPPISPLESAVNFAPTNPPTPSHQLSPLHSSEFLLGSNSNTPPISPPYSPHSHTSTLGYSNNNRSSGAGRKSHVVDDTVSKIKKYNRKIDLLLRQLSTI